MGKTIEKKGSDLKVEHWLDERGKLWGWLHPLDLAIILVIFLVGIKVVIDYRPAPLQEKSNLITLGLLVSDIPPYLVESLAVGQDLFQDRTRAYLGKIRTITTQPAELILQKAGELRIVQSPRNRDLRLELQRKGAVFKGDSKYGVYLGKLAVRVGDSLDCGTLYTSLRAKIEYLKVVDD